MALTPEELESQIESLNATIAEQKQAGEKAAEEIKVRDQKIAELAEAAKKAPGADYEELKAKAAKLTDVEKENLQLKTQVTLGELRAKYPDVDFTLVPNGTKEDMESTAGKIQAAITAALKKHLPNGAPNGAPVPPKKSEDPWSGLPPANGDLDETRRRQDAQAQDKVIEDAKRKGDAAGVLDGIVVKHGGFPKSFGFEPAKK